MYRYDETNVILLKWENGKVMGQICMTKNYHFYYVSIVLVEYQVFIGIRNKITASGYTGALNMFLNLYISNVIVYTISMFLDLRSK